MIKNLLIGSKNKAKIAEWKEFLSPFVEVLTLDDFTKTKEPEESGSTFEENARIKARFYAEKFNQYVFAEDGGFEVDALGGEPGVKSRRILPGDTEASDLQIVEYILERARDLPKDRRAARLKVAVAIANPLGKIMFEESSSIEGLVVEKVDFGKLIEGYPYRSLLYIPGVEKTYADLSEDEHKNINHKKAIVKKIQKSIIQS